MRILAHASGGCRPKARVPCTSTSGRRSSISSWKAWAGCGVGDETLTVPKYGGVLVGPEQLRQVFNDTNDEVLWLIVGAPEEIEFLQGSKSKADLSLIYPVDPKQLPKELAGVEWPPKD